MLQFEFFITYMRNRWLGTIGPAMLSLYRAPNRTNNAVESCNAKLKRKVGTRPRIWELMGEYYDDILTDE